MAWATGAGAGRGRTRQTGAQKHLRVVPLFETKADLEQAGHTVQALLDIDWYLKVSADARQRSRAGDDGAAVADPVSCVWHGRGVPTAH